MHTRSSLRLCALIAPVLVVPDTLSAQDPAYLTPTEVEAAIDAAVAANPTIAQKVDLSALSGGVPTHEGRSIFALKLSDNVAVDEDEPAIVVAGQAHARELNAPIMITGAINRILAGYPADPQIRALVDEHELYLVPCMNPDGVNHVWTVDPNWRKNRRNNGANFGVDINRNGPFLWSLCGGSTVTSSETYRGPSSGSEPEVRTMRNLITRLRPEIYVDFHSFGQEVLHLYPPCAVVSPAVAAMDTRYVDDLRTPMTYGQRAPSASGEMPHDYWGNGGTLSYLIEVGTSFQPPFATTVAEEVRVWPGLQRPLFSWRPAVRGHVRSSLGFQPLDATITYTPNQFQHGETTRSRVRDGRYGLWLPIGTWDVTWSAAGHTSRTTTVTVTGYDQPQTVEVLLEPVGPVATVVKSGSERIGTTVTFTYTSPGDAGRTYLLGWSLGTTPGLPLGGLRVLPLNPDFLFTAAVNTNAILSPTWGTLDGNGQANVFLALPNSPLVVGFTTWVAGITFDGNYHLGIAKWSAPVSVTPLP